MVAAIGLSTTANCQSLKDSSIIANKDLRKAAILIEQGKGCAVERSLLEKANNLLQVRINYKDSVIESYYTMELNNSAIINTYKLKETTYKEMLDIRKNELAVVNKSLKRQKRKTFFTALLGVVGIVGTAYLVK